MIDEIVNEDEVVEVLDYIGYKGSNLYKCRVNNDLIECKLNMWIIH